MINLAKIAEQWKNQRAIKAKNQNSKQTRDRELAQTLEPTSLKLTNCLKETSTSYTKHQTGFTKFSKSNAQTCFS